MKFKKEDEDPISNDIGFPYNIIPKGYPNKIRNNKIEETINVLVENIKANSGVFSNEILINLGQTELNNRTSRTQSRIAFWVSLISLLISIIALAISYQSSNQDDTIRKLQLNELKEIKQILYNK